MGVPAGTDSPHRSLFAGALFAGGSVSLRSSKRFSVLAVVVAYSLIEAALWSYGPVQLAMGLLAAAWIFGCTLVQRRSARELGLSGEGFRQSIWFPLAGLAVAGAVFWIAREAGTLNLPPGRLHPWHVYGYAVWAFEQEFILQSFLFLNLERLLGRRSAIISSTLLFAFAHVPNPLLMVCTFFGGLMFTAMFARYRNLWTIGFVHALLGLTIALTAPDSINHHMRVGLGYLHYRPAPSRAVLMPPAQR